MSSISKNIFKLCGPSLFLSSLLFSPIILAVTQQANIGVNIVSAGTITKNTDLSFGTLGSSISTSETVIISPTSSKNTNSNKAAIFFLSGRENTAFSISTPSSITVTSGVYTMLVDKFTTQSSSNYFLSGNALIKVGASVHIPKNQVVGHYTGSFTLTVDYQ